MLGSEGEEIVPCTGTVLNDNARDQVNIEGWSYRVE